MNLNAITIHRSQHDAGVPTGPADLALPFSVPTAVGTRAPEVATATVTSVTGGTRTARSRRRSGSAARRRTAA